VRAGRAVGPLDELDDRAVVGEDVGVEVLDATPIGDAAQLADQAAAEAVVLPAVLDEDGDVGDGGVVGIDVVAGEGDDLVADRHDQRFVLAVVDVDHGPAQRPVEPGRHGEEAAVHGGGGQAGEHALQPDVVAVRPHAGDDVEADHDGPSGRTMRHVAVAWA
jgi:hypothetical protein